MSKSDPPSLLAYLDPDRRWPEIGDRLFTHGSEADALLPDDATIRLMVMAEGYRAAGDLLAQQSLYQPQAGHFLIYPAVFCYRHFIELALKSLLDGYGDAVGIAVDWRSHDLMPRWRDVLRMIEAYGMAETDDGMVAVEACIAEFDKVDPGSLAFRYRRTPRADPLR